MLLGPSLKAQIFAMLETTNVYLDTYIYIYIIQICRIYAYNCVFMLLGRRIREYGTRKRKQYIYGWNSHIVG